MGREALPEGWGFERDGRGWESHLECQERLVCCPGGLGGTGSLYHTVRKGWEGREGSGRMGGVRWPSRMWREELGDPPGG